MIGEFADSEKSPCVISKMEALAWFEPIAHLKIVDLEIKVDHAFLASPQSVGGPHGELPFNLRPSRLI